MAGRALGCIRMGTDADRRRLRLAAALRRVSKQLAAWDLIDALELLPNSPRPTIEQPRLGREQLKSVQVELWR